MISGLKDKSINRIKIAIVGICSLIIGVIVLDLRNNSQALMFVYQHISELLPFTLVILSETNNILCKGDSGPSNGSAPTTESPSSKKGYFPPVPSKDLTDTELNDMFGEPNKEKLTIVRDKIRAQTLELSKRV